MLDKLLSYTLHLQPTSETRVAGTMGMLAGLAMIHRCMIRVEVRIHLTQAVLAI